ncbi:hypothetical protein D3C78_19070 [compost metagenome]
MADNVVYLPSDDAQYNLHTWVSMGAAKLPQWPIMEKYANHIEPSVVHEMIRKSVPVGKRVGVITASLNIGSIADFDIMELMRLCDMDAGRIHLNRVSIREMEKSVRLHIAAFFMSVMISHTVSSQ